MRKKDLYKWLSVLVVIAILSSPTVESSLEDRSSPAEQDTLVNEPAVEDLNITDMTFSDDEPREDQNVTITITVENKGTEEQRNLSLILINIDQIISLKEVSLAPGNNSFPFFWQAEGGNQNITALLVRGTPDMEDISDFRSEDIVDTFSVDIWVEPESMGDIYTPLLALGLIIVVLFGSALIPSIWRAISDRGGHKRRKF